MNEEIKSELKDLIAQYRRELSLFARKLDTVSANKVNRTAAEIAAFVAINEDAILAERPNDGPLMTEYLRWLNNAQVNPPKRE